MLSHHVHVGPFASPLLNPADRIASAHSEVNSQRDTLNRGEWPISDSTDIHAVCDLIKSWFRILPGGLFPSETYGSILSAAGKSCVCPFQEATLTAAPGRDDVDLRPRVENIVAGKRGGGRRR